MSYFLVRDGSATMLRILRFLYSGDWHLHEWETINEVKVRYHASDPMPYKTKYVCKCRHCGVITKFNC